MLDGKKIIITGGTGTFGQAFARMTAARFNPRSIVIFSRDDMKQYHMRKEQPHLDYFVGDIRDKERLRRAFWAADVVIHAAALKIVDSGEYNPFEYIKTNIMGSMNVLDAAIDQEVPQVVGISTDKAVSPINLYGNTKACMERLFLAANNYNVGGAPCISVVRYGNVMGSNGSVIPLFLRQRQQGVLTITHPHMTRFMMTIEEAVEFVWTTLETHKPGIHTPRAPAMRIMDVADVIAPEAEKRIIGIRPGEKLHEVMYETENERYSSDNPARWMEKGELDAWLKSNYAR